MRSTLTQLFFATLFAAPIGAAAQVPANDACSAAIGIGCGETLPGTTTNATVDDVAECGTVLSSPGVWYTFTGTGDQVLVSTCFNHSYDTKVSVYTGGCGALECLGGNDDSEGCDYGSRFAFPSTNGTVYHILVHGYEDQTGDFELEIECVDLPNDLCASALPLTCFGTVDGSTTYATFDDVEECGTGIQAPGIWYTFTGVDATVILSTCENFGYDTRINVFSGSCTDLVCVTGNDDSPDAGVCSEAVFLAEPDETYFVLVQGYDGATGDFGLSMTCLPCGTPTEVFVTPTDVAATVYWTSSNDNAGFSVEYGLAGFTLGTGTVVTGQVGIDGPPLTITDLEPSNAYQIYIREDCGDEGMSGTAGPVAFSTLGQPPPANALCAGAEEISCGGTVTGDSSLGLFAPGPHCGAANITSAGLWYTFTGTGEEVTLSTCGEASFDTKISVFSNTCSALVCVAGNDDSPGCPDNRSSVSFPTANGTVYLVFVHGYQDNAGPFVLGMSCAPLCSPEVTNDACPLAALTALNPITACEPTVASTACAYVDAMPNPGCDPYAPVADVWFVFNTADQTECAIALSPISAAQVHMAVYTGCDANDIVLCETEVNGTIDLTELATNTDHYIRIWNAGGDEAGTFSLCVEADLSTGIADAMNDVFRIRPVPAHDQLNIDGALQGPLTITDLQGRDVMSVRANGTTTTIDVSGLAPGSYILRTPLDGRTIGRFIKE